MDYIYKVIKSYAVLIPVLFLFRLLFLKFEQFKKVIAISLLVFVLFYIGYFLNPSLENDDFWKNTIFIGIPSLFFIFTIPSKSSANKVLEKDIKLFKKILNKFKN